MHVFVGMFPGLGVAPSQMSAHVGTVRRSRRIVPLLASLKAHILVRVIVYIGIGAVLRVAALENGTSPRTIGRRSPGKRHILVEVFLLVAVLGIGESVAVDGKRTGAMGRIRNAALRQGF